MAPESPLQAGVILRPAEEIAHQLPEHRTAPHKLHHPRGNRTSQKRSAVETPHDARRKLQFRAKGSFYPCRILFRATLRERSPEQFARANRIEKSFASQWINPRRRISDQRPVFSMRSEEHTSELQSHSDLVCRLLLEKKITNPAPRRS